MNSLFDKIHYWLGDYTKPEERHHVALLMYNIAKKYNWAAFRWGLFIGFAFGILLLQWAR